jgi:hypothetical protein
MSDTYYIEPVFTADFEERADAIRSLLSDTRDANIELLHAFAEHSANGLVQYMAKADNLTRSDAIDAARNWIDDSRDPLERHMTRIEFHLGSSTLTELQSRWLVETYSETKLVHNQLVRMLHHLDTLSNGGAQ